MATALNLADSHSNSNYPVENHKKPKLHHLKSTRKSRAKLEKSYLKPVAYNQPNHASYLGLKPTRMSSVKSHDSLSSPLSDYIEEVDEHEEQNDEIHERINIWYANGSPKNE